MLSQTASGQATSDLTPGSSVAPLTPGPSLPTMGPLRGANIGCAASPRPSSGEAGGEGIPGDEGLPGGEGRWRHLPLAAGEQEAEPEQQLAGPDDRIAEHARTGRLRGPPS